MMDKEQYPAPCVLCRKRRGKAVLCGADWHVEYGERRRNPFGYVKDIYFCTFLCEKRPDLFTVTLKEKRNAEVF